jgi:hypothetical protein
MTAIERILDERFGIGTRRIARRARRDSVPRGDVTEVALRTLRVFADSLYRRCKLSKQSCSPRIELAFEEWDARHG